MAIKPVPPQEQPLEPLLVKIARGEEQALTKLYNIYGSRVAALTQAILGRGNESEDAALDAFTKIWDRARGYDPQLGSAKAWIHTIARNCALDRLRKKERRGALEKENGEEAHTLNYGDPEQDLLEDEQGRIVAQALQKLSRPQKATLLAAYFEGLSHRQISERLHMPLGTVKTHIRKGLSALKEQMQGENPFSGS